MKAPFFKPICSTTLIAALLTGVTPVLAASPQPTETTAAASEATAPVELPELTLDQALEKAIDCNIDVKVLHLDSDSAFFTSRVTLQGTNKIDPDTITNLNGAKSKYETAADAIRDFYVAESKWRLQENSARLDIQKTFFEALAAQNRLELQKTFITQQESETARQAAEEQLREMEGKYREVLGKLNRLMNEAADKQWKLTGNELTDSHLLPLEDYKSKAYQRRPEIVQNSAERDFAQAKVNYVHQYASLSTYPGRIAQNDLEKAELLLQKAQNKVNQEVGDFYTKATQAKEAWEESLGKEKSAEEQYRAAYIAYLNKEASSAELAEQRKKWMESANNSVESRYQFNVAVASLQYSAGF